MSSSARCWANIVSGKKPIEQLPETPSVTTATTASTTTIIPEKDSTSTSTSTTTITTTRPEFIYLSNPSRSKVVPIFRNEDEEHKWALKCSMEDKEYSNTQYNIQLKAWEDKNNWHTPPMKTGELTEEERSVGFRLRDADQEPMYSYRVPYDTCHTYVLERYLHKLIFNRAAELRACRTVGDFRVLFENTICHEFRIRVLEQFRGRSTISAYNYHEQSCVDRMPAYKDALWLLSRASNVFRTSAIHEIPSWKLHPDEQRRIRDEYTYEEERANPEEIYPRGTIFNIRGGRNPSGYCIVENMSQNKDQAKIRWLVSVEEMRAIQMVHFEPESCPECWRKNDWDDDDYW
jgi:hypothetical protein